MRDLPKVELHLHIEGAAPPAFVRDLAREKSADLSRLFDADGRYVYAGFLRFLKVYEAVTEVMRSPEDYARLTRAVLSKSAAEGVIYTEIFASPEFCGGRDPGAWRDYLHAIRDAASAAKEEEGIAMRAIVTPIRHFGPDKAREVARCAAETAGDFVTGFGIAGDENAGSLVDFAWSFDMVREAGLGLTEHAGEWAGPASVRTALDALRVARIEHGVRAIEDRDLVARLAERGTVHEVCPSSNIALGVYQNWRDHPIERLRAAGVAVTVSTDDPPFFRTNMTREYEMLARTFGWDEERVRETSLVAARAAFCDEETRVGLFERITA